MNRRVAAGGLGVFAVGLQVGCGYPGEPLPQVLREVQGGDSGPAITPGSLDKSALWEAIDTNRMPPGRNKLSPGEKALIQKWILGGDTQIDASGATIEHVGITAAGDIPGVVAHARETQPAWERLGIAGRARIFKRAQQWLNERQSGIFGVILGGTDTASKSSASVGRSTGRCRPTWT